MRKRKTSEEEEGSEMEVDDEEKVEINEESDEESNEDEDDMSDDEDPDPSRVQTRIENPFLDSFYGLSSEDSRERSQAAQTMLQHCLLGPSANSKDSAYAFRRLLNGVCSGRAAARQGNASALASFLKIAFQLGKMEEIHDETTKDGSESPSMLAYVRERLRVATDPNQTTGKKKGSEERDYQFGRLFGILAVVRSDILLPSESGGSSLSDIIEVSSDFASDLAELFWLKKWMREPAAHGITTLLKMFYDGKSKDECVKVAQHLVEGVVIPKVLQMNSSGVEAKSNDSGLFKSYCAEQIGIASFIQCQAQVYPDGLPSPLDKPVLSTETIPFIAQALSETSVVIQPRTHFVWDTLWCFLTETQESSAKSKSPKHPTKVCLRTSCPVGEENAADIIDCIITEVVMKKLLGIEKEQGNSSGKATHERRSLALCIVKTLSGVAFLSSVSGPTQILLEPDLVENILLSPDIIRSLFLAVICAGSQKKQTSHLLKPLALDVLESLTDAVTEQGREKQLACVRAFLNCEIRFDARTKTSTVSDLLGLTNPVKEGMGDEKFAFWNGHLEYLETKLLAHCTETKDGVSSAEATGYVELLYSAAKNILRLEAESESDKFVVKEYKEKVIHRILNIFMVSAFFNCEGIEAKKKKGKKASKASANPVLEIASTVKQCYEEGDGITHAIRSVISARFFSLVSDFMNHATHQQGEDHKGKLEKDSTTLSILIGLCDNWKLLEASGAKRFASSTEKDEDEDSSLPDEVVEELRNIVKETTKLSDSDSDNSMKESKKRCCTGIAVLAYSLYLHRLSCGEDGTMENDDPDADGENDEEEICNALEGLKAVANDFLQESSEEANPLHDLAELCANILSSPLGSGNMGRAASPKLVRETVKFAWLGGLRLSSEMASTERTLLDAGVIGILLEAVGAANDYAVDEDGSDDEGESEEEDDDDTSEASGDEGVFSKASGLLDDPEEMEVDEKDVKAAVEDSDVELDPDNLRSLLEQDSDADNEEFVLEHHEGADAALAKLLRAKQDARKAGQQAREKIETSHQLRCTFLIELLLGRPDGWNRLFRSEIMLKMVLPMLNHRKKIERSLKKSMESKSKTGSGEKQALLDRLTSLLKLKLCKLRLSSMPLESSLDVEFATDLVTKIVDEAKRADNKEHASCSSYCLMFVFRSMQSVPDALSAASVCGDAVSEWSTKRTTRLDASVFDEMIVHTPR
jgi:hypothetical protein